MDEQGTMVGVPFDERERFVSEWDVLNRIPRSATSEQYQQFWKELKLIPVVPVFWDTVDYWKVEDVVPLLRIRGWWND